MSPYSLYPSERMTVMKENVAGWKEDTGMYQRVVVQEVGSEVYVLSGNVEVYYCSSLIE